MSSSRSSRRLPAAPGPPRAAPAAAPPRRCGAALHRRGAAEIAPAADLALLLVFAATAAAAIEQRQVAAEALDHDLGRILLLAGLVGPFAGLELARDIDLGALLEVLLGDAGDVLVEDHHPVPLGLLLALAGGLFLPALRGGEAEVHDGLAGAEPPDFRVLAEVADQDDLVHAARHRSSPLSRALTGPIPGRGQPGRAAFAALSPLFRDMTLVLVLFRLQCKGRP